MVLAHVVDENKGGVVCKIGQGAAEVHCIFIDVVIIIQRPWADGRWSLALACKTMISSNPNPDPCFFKCTYSTSVFFSQHRGELVADASPFQKDTSCTHYLPSLHFPEGSRRKHALTAMMTAFAPMRGLVRSAGLSRQFVAGPAKCVCSIANPHLDRSHTGFVGRTSISARGYSAASPGKPAKFAFCFEYVRLVSLALGL